MLDNQVVLKENHATSSSLMQKLTITTTGTYFVDAVPGRTTYISSSGNITATVQYLTAPGVTVAMAAPPTLANPTTQLSVVNYGAHSELAIVVTAVTGTAIVIANPQALMERGR